MWGLDFIFRSAFAGMLILAPPNSGNQLNCAGLPISTGVSVAFDADLASSFVFSSGSTISSWADHSGHVTPAIALNGFTPPTRVLNVLNSRAGTLWSNNLLYYGHRSPALAPPIGDCMLTQAAYTIFFVGNSTAGTGHTSPFFTFENYPDETGWMTAVMYDGDTGYGDISFGAFGNNPNGGRAANSVKSDGTFYTMEMKYLGSSPTSAASYTFWANGTSYTTTTGTAELNTNDNYLGYFGTGATHTGYINEVILYDGALSSADETTIRTCLRSKWATY